MITIEAIENSTSQTFKDLTLRICVNSEINNQADIILEYEGEEIFTKNFQIEGEILFDLIGINPDFKTTQQLKLTKKLEISVGLLLESIDYQFEGILFSSYEAVNDSLMNVLKKIVT